MHGNAVLAVSLTCASQLYLLVCSISQDDILISSQRFLSSYEEATYKATLEILGYLRNLIGTVKFHIPVSDDVQLPSTEHHTGVLDSHIGGISVSVLTTVFVQCRASRITETISPAIWAITRPHGI